MPRQHGDIGLLRFGVFAFCLLVLLLLLDKCRVEAARVWQQKIGEKLFNESGRNPIDFAVPR
jgi:hypothetical protein